MSCSSSSPVAVLAAAGYAAEHGGGSANQDPTAADVLAAAGYAAEHGGGSANQDPAAADVLVAAGYAAEHGGGFLDEDRAATAAAAGVFDLPVKQQLAATSHDADEEDACMLTKQHQTGESEHNVSFKAPLDLSDPALWKVDDKVF
ncbi:unnamed protein product [Arctogadus glacialis]